MNRVEQLMQQVGHLTTSVGAAFPGSRAVFRGHDLHRDLGHLSWIELCAFGITGRRLPAAQLRVLEFIWVNTSYPDARIWNNRVAALAGTTRSTPNLAITAGHALSEAMIYGRRNEFRALAFFTRALKERQGGATVADCIQRHLQRQGKLAGYGRPLASGDERIGPTMAYAREQGVAGGPHVALAFEVEEELRAQGKALAMNFGALVSAFGADFGFTPREFTMFLYPAFLGGMQPCYLEASAKPPGAVFPTPCSEVQYEGAAKRAWPATSPG